LKNKGDNDKVDQLKDKLSKFEDKKTLNQIFGQTPKKQTETPKDVVKDQEWFNQIEKKYKSASPSEKKEMKEFYGIYHKNKFSKDKWKQLFGESVDIFKYNKDVESKHGSSQASQEAKNLGLTYLGFGRYGKRASFGSSFEVTHYVDNGRLEPWDRWSPEGYDGFYNKDQAGPELADQITKGTEENHYNEQKKAQSLPQIDDITSYVFEQYQNDGYIDINESLWGRPNPELPESQKENVNKQIETMDKFFDSSPHVVLDEDKIVYSGTAMNLENGGEYEFQGFLSSSSNLPIAETFVNTTSSMRDAVLIQFNLKKGQKAAYMDNVSGTQSKGNPEEFEYILPRGTQFKITEGPIQGKRYKIWKAEIINQPKQKKLPFKLKEKNEKTS